MRVFFDIWTTTLWKNSTGTVLSPLGMKKGDALPFYVTFLRNETPRQLAEPSHITFGLKLQIGDTGFIAVAEDFEWNAPTQSYRAILNLNTQEIIDAMDGVNQFECFSELSYTDLNNGPISSQTIPTTIYREVVTGDEGSPVLLPDADDWLTARAVRFDLVQTLDSLEKALARDNIGLGDSATLDVGQTAGTVAAGNDPRFGAITPTQLASTIHSATGKTTPADGDEFPITDSASSFSLKKLTWGDLVAAIAPPETDIAELILASSGVSSPNADFVYAIVDPGDSTLHKITHADLKAAVSPNTAFFDLGFFNDGETVSPDLSNGQNQKISIGSNDITVNLESPGSNGVLDGSRLTLYVYCSGGDFTLSMSGILYYGDFLPFPRTLEGGRWTRVEFEQISGQWNLIGIAGHYQLD